MASRSLSCALIDDEAPYLDFSASMSTFFDPPVPYEVFALAAGDRDRRGDRDRELRPRRPPRDDL